MTTLEDLVVRVGADVDDAEDAVGGLSGAIDRHFAAITGAGVAAGAGLEAFARNMAPLNEANSRLAAMTGESEQAMRDLALETSNVGFPLEEVQGLMETGSQRGLEGADALQRYANFWDMVGDATGESATALGDAGTALAAVGIQAGNEAQAVNALGFITENTTGSVGDFLSFLERTGPELRSMGIDVNDAAAILGVMEQELGMTGRTARSEFRTAVVDSEGDMGKLLDILGVSEKQFNSYRGAVDDASGVLERNAEINDESFTPLQRLTHGAEELMFKYGGLADVAGAVAIPLMALGPVVKGLSLGYQLLTGSIVRNTIAWTASKVATIAGAAATGVATAAQWLWNIALSANPIGLIIIAIVALVAAFVLLWKNSETFRNIVTGVFQAVAAVVRWWWENIVKRYFEFVKAAFRAVADVGRWLWERIKAYFGFWRGVFDTVIGWVVGLKDRIVNRFNAIVDFIRGLPGRISRAASGMFNGIRDAFRGAINGIISGWNNLSFTLPSIDVPFFGSVGGFTLSTPNIPFLAKGGIVTGPTLAMLGEGGHDEAVIPLPRGMRAGQAGGATVLEIHSGGTKLDDALVEILARAVRVRGGNVQLVLGRG